MSCCNDKSCAMEQLHARQSAMLRVVLVLNAMMFVVELGAGLMANSVSLLADSLDMLGDALVYGFSLWVVGRGLGLEGARRGVQGRRHGGFRSVRFGRTRLQAAHSPATRI